MKISKTKISKRIEKKRNPSLVETIKLAKKNNQLELAKQLSRPTRLQSKINLDELNELKESKILVVGKVLGQGEIGKKLEIAALNFSESAKEKLEKNGSKIMTIKKYLESSKNIDGVKIL
jgi:large subunit ribosomal protein L18e